MFGRLSDILTCILPLSRFFQRVEIDLKSAQDMLNDTLKILSRRRENCETVFATIYQEICGIAEELHVELKLRRISGNQNYRENYSSDNSISYFRQSIYVPVLDNVVEDLKSRFPCETLELYNLSVLFPDFKGFYKDNGESVQILAEKYSPLLNKPVDMVKQSITSELELWSLKWEREPNIGSRSALDLLNECDKDPYIHFLLTVLATLTFSVASAERSFSCLRRLKTWLRSEMGEERLTGLALLNIHCDVKVDPEIVIDTYANKRKHRLEFIL